MQYRIIRTWVAVITFVSVCSGTANPEIVTKMLLVDVGSAVVRIRKRRMNVWYLTFLQLFFRLLPWSPVLLPSTLHCHVAKHGVQLLQHPIVTAEFHAFVWIKIIVRMVSDAYCSERIVSFLHSQLLSRSWKCWNFDLVRMKIMCMRMLALTAPCGSYLRSWILCLNKAFRCKLLLQYKNL